MRRRGELIMQAIGDLNFLCNVVWGGGGVINGFQTFIIFIHSSLPVTCFRESVCNLLRAIMFTGPGERPSVTFERLLVSHIAIKC